MKLLLANPNISESATVLIRGGAERAALAQTSLTVLTAPYGVVYMEIAEAILIGGRFAIVGISERIRAWYL